MASSSSYQVYMSFHEPDVGKTFISPLRKQVNYYGISMFDDQRVERSPLIPPALTQAIRESRISIVVLSGNYASSSWCLDELLEILNAGQIVMIVFYGVGRSDVQKQTGKFGFAFRETCDGRTEEEQRKWSQALTTVANIDAYDFEKCYTKEDMIQKIAKDVSDKLNDTSSRDVFLSSFCNRAFGPYFRRVLHQNGVDTFQSYRCLQTSVIPINQQTLMALELAKVAVGFLEELRVILEFREKGSLTVIPVSPGSPVSRTHLPFYVVEEEMCQQYPENALSWRTALTKLANIAAQFPFSQKPAGMDRTDWFYQISQDILFLLYSTSNDLNGLVAMDRHMKVVYDLLASDVNKEVCTIGIWGSVGVGKTTLARYIYAQISVNFQTHVFLANVENMKDKILKFEGEDDPTLITSLDRNEHEITQARRKHRKVLLIADDVNNIEQGKWIIEYANQFAPGSRVILISQNKNLLVDAGVMDVYEVTSLRYDEALQLFSHFAFKHPYSPSDFEQLAVRAVHLAGFLPLSLRLLGSFLTGRDREQWVAALKTMQGENIEEVWTLM